MTGVGGRAEWFCCVPRPERERCQSDSPYSKRHALYAGPKEYGEGLGRRAAICGVRPALGWYTDLFVNTDGSEDCKRCTLALRAALARLEQP